MSMTKMNSYITYWEQRILLHLLDCWSIDKGKVNIEYLSTMSRLTAARIPRNRNSCDLRLHCDRSDHNHCPRNRTRSHLKDRINNFITETSQSTRRTFSKKSSWSLSWGFLYGEAQVNKFAERVPKWSHVDHSNRWQTRLKTSPSCNLIGRR